MEKMQEKKIEDEMIITPLGSGCEVGRSCILMKFKGKTIMFDCGLHQGKRGYESLPYFDSCIPSEIDLILITHFHTDHCAALPYFLKKTDFLKGKGKIYMTSPTKAIYRPFTQDSLKIKSENISIFKKEDVEMTMRHIDIINFNQEFEYNGIKFKCYCAGHVLGAAMFQVEIDGVKVLYTGDYSTEIERLMRPAEIPLDKIDVLIVESTFGITNHMPRKEREERLKKLIYDVVCPKMEEGKKRGKVLMPVTTSGRAEELLLILDELWEERPEIQDVPIQFKSKKFDKFKEIFQIYLELTPKEIRNKTINPFDYKYVTVTKEAADFEKGQANKDKPCVILASPGQMNEGSHSRELFQDWCQDEDNLCILTGFCQEGSFARSLQKDINPSVKLKNGETIQSKMQIATLSFCAHADFDQTKYFISSIEPEYVVLVHGQEKRAKDLQKEIQKQFKNKIKKVATPKNQELEKFYFQKRQMCKIIGSLHENVQKQIQNFQQYVNKTSEKNAQQKEQQQQQIIEEEEEKEKEKQKQDIENETNQVQDQEQSFEEEIQENKESLIEEGKQMQTDNIEIVKKEQIVQQRIKVDGILYQNEDNQMLFMNPNDKNTNVPIQRVQVKEKLKIQYKGEMELLLFFAQQVINPQASLKNVLDRPTIFVKEGLQIEKVDNDIVSLNWVSSNKMDQIVENFSMLIFQLTNQQNAVQTVQSKASPTHIFSILQNEFPQSRIDLDQQIIIVSSENKHEVATINLKTHEIHTNDTIVEKRLKGVLSLIEEFQN